MASIHKNEVEAAVAALNGDYDKTLDIEVQTDKDMVKLVPCRECKRPLVVTTFFAPAKAICRVCKGEADATGVATVGQPSPGETDPAKAVNLADCLINAHFAVAVCPAHPDADDHEMELVNVSHSDNYGPSTFLGYINGKPHYRQTAKGETALHQCRTCKATVVYSTTAQQQLRRQNEPKIQPDLGRRPGIHLELLNGVRREEDQ